MNPLSLDSMRRIDYPSLPDLAVLPDLWMKKLGSYGGSNYTTNGTSSKSIPRANTSVVNNTYDYAYDYLNAVNILTLFFYFIFPCIEWNVMQPNSVNCFNNKL